MNRLKFRVWDKLAQRFIYPDRGYQGHYVLSLNGEFTNLQNGAGGDDFVVQQWTGFTDKNGIDIFEGDILLDGPNINTKYIIMEWDSVWGRWTMSYVRSMYGSSEIPTHLEYLDVVGNIFENKGLLNEKS